MEATKKIIKIDGIDIMAEDKDIPQVTLKFYPENPRIKTIIEAECGENPSQQEIESKMKTLDHVKELRRSIKANGGLLEPIIVKDNIVLEGNSRLAAYRLLCEEDPIQWGRIRATILPSNVSEDAIFSMLGTLHIVGKTPWNPFEQAGYISRRLSQSRKNIDAIASDLGLPRSAAKLMMATYNRMLANDDLEPSKWSYYNEFEKNSAIRKADENYPQLNIVDTILERIKADEFSDARELRKVGTIMKAEGETASEAIHSYIDGSMSIDEAVELVQSENKLSNLQSKIKNISQILEKEERSIIDNLTDTQLRFFLQSIQQRINHILTRL